MAKATNTSNQIEELTTEQKKPIEYAVFSGGGAKGAGYSGVYESLKKAEIMDDLKGVAGSSAGAISAALIATGIEPEAFAKISTETNLVNLLGNGMLSKDGKPLYNLLSSTIRENILNYFKDTPNIVEMLDKRSQNLKEEQTQILSKIDILQKEANSTTPEKKQSIEENIKNLQETYAENIKIAAKIDDLRSHNNGHELKEIRRRCAQKDKILFKDLELLRICDPIRFKELLVTAVNKENGELKIFSSANTPDVEIALACRASASIPIFFESVEIDGIKYVDGGYRDNIPLGYFTENAKQPLAEDITDNQQEIKQAQKDGRTLAFAFGSTLDGPAHIALYSSKKLISDPNAIVKFLMDVVFKTIARVGGTFLYSETENATYNKVRDNALNTVILDTGSIGTLSFDKAQKQANYLHIKGAIQTLNYLAQFEVGSQPDPTYRHREFLLGVYEDAISNKEKSFVAKVTGWHNDIKNEQLLEFCAPEKWSTNTKEKSNDPVQSQKDDKEAVEQRREILKECIVLAASQAPPKSLSENTRTVSILIDKLNDPNTSYRIKHDFVRVLGIETHLDNRNLDPRFKPENHPGLDPKKAYEKNINDCKFTKKDFKAFLDKNKTADIASTELSKLEHRDKGRPTTTQGRG